MHAHRLTLDLIAEPGPAFDPVALIPVFHRFIQTGALPWLLIDVADYRHVAQGPGVLLIGHEADLAVGERDGRVTLAYGQKRAESGDFDEHLRRAVDRLLTAARLLNAEPSLEALTFPTDRWQLTVRDRLTAPNTAETLEQLAPGLRQLFGELYPDTTPELQRVAGDPRRAFSVRLEAPEQPGLGVLSERLAGAVVA